MIAPTVIPQAWLHQSTSRGSVRVPLRVARCPGCHIDPQHPTARTCEKVGCPVKHMGGVPHDFAGAA